jgi:hypothetical protein
MSGHDHEHHHDHSELSETQLRVRALETVLTEKGYVDPAALELWGADGDATAKVSVDAWEPYLESA